MAGAAFPVFSQRREIPLPVPLDFLSFLTEQQISGAVTLWRFRKPWISEPHDIKYFRKPQIFRMSDIRNAGISLHELEDFGF